MKLLLRLKPSEFERQHVQRQFVGLVRLEQKFATLALCIESLSELAAESTGTQVAQRHGAWSLELGTRLRAIEASCDTHNLPHGLLDSTCHLQFF